MSRTSLPTQTSGVRSVAVRSVAPLLCGGEIMTRGPAGSLGGPEGHDVSLVASAVCVQGFLREPRAL